MPSRENRCAVAMIGVRATRLTNLQELAERRAGGIRASLQRRAREYALRVLSGVGRSDDGDASLQQRRRRQVDCSLGDAAFSIALNHAGKFPRSLLPHSRKVRSRCSVASALAKSYGPCYVMFLSAAPPHEDLFALLALFRAISDQERQLSRLLHASQTTEL
jgi:hypothetical protein